MKGQGLKFEVKGQRAFLFLTYVFDFQKSE